MTDYNYNVNPQQPQQNPYGATAPNAGKSDRRVLGMWGLWLGIASIVIGPFLFGLLSVAAIVLGAIAISKESRSKGLGIWGIVLGAVGFIWMLLFWFAVVPLLILAGLWMFVDTIPTYSYYTTF